MESKLAISLVVPVTTEEFPPVQRAAEDCTELLALAFPNWDIRRNDLTANVVIRLPEILSTSAKEPRSFSRPDASYIFSSQREGEQIRIFIESHSAEGVCSALYGLLQDHLGFRFFHPRQSIIPCHDTWPLPARFQANAAPLFATRGFHLHTLHPMELSEQLHDPSHPGGRDEIDEYLRWLARNRQNHFQFYLLRGIDRQHFPEFAQWIVNAAHGRGIRVSIHVSLSMLQQRAFQLVHLVRTPRRQRKELTDRIAWLLSTPWDMITVEPTMGEYLPDLWRHGTSLRDLLIRLVTEKHSTPLMISTHVIRRPGDQLPLQLPKRDPQAAPVGVLVHSVMCYGLDDTFPPVYGNGDFGFVRKRLQRESRRRETWYWPESSYWICFDTSVPLFLSPYLASRHADMAIAHSSGVNGHLTFSSGWEWGYWLTDWSVCHWSWEQSINGVKQLSSAISPLQNLLDNDELTVLLAKAFTLQQRALISDRLLPYLTAADPFSELPRIATRQFQPLPPLTPFQITRGEGDVHRLFPTVIAPLFAYSKEMEEICTAISNCISISPPSTEHALDIAHELCRALRLTAMRARHRGMTLRAAATFHHGVGRSLKSLRRAHWLSRAAAIRLQAVEIVRQQEKFYRYPIAQLARKRPSFTAYAFGYLMPASELHFWMREEEQVRRRRFDPFLLNIWDWWRVAGIGSLFGDPKL